jgi:hypothetical protein
MRYKEMMRERVREEYEGIEVGRKGIQQEGKGEGEHGKG